jgi:signal transduction histidine kinase
MLVEPIDPYAESQPLYNYTVDRLVQEPSFFKACILRIGEHANAIEVVAKAGEGIFWEKRIDAPRMKGEGSLTGRIYANGEPILIEDIEPQKHLFKNIDWIEHNKLRSYAGFPLKVELKTVGTLSLFMGFPYKFYPSDIDYVSNITYLLAAFTRNIISAKEITSLNEQVQREKEEIYSHARGIAYTREVDEVMHEYKNELLTLLHALGESESASPGRRSQIIQERMSWAKKRLEEIKKSFIDRAEVPVNLNNIVRAVAKVFTTENRKRIRFLFDYETPLPEIMAVEAEIRDVVFNLISNAVKAIEKAGRKQGVIKISTENIDEGDIEYLQLCVDDNGVGIRNEDVDKLYQRGFTTYKGGTGMGLYLARKIVEAYGGKITFTSTVGKGSKFCVKIPLKRNQAWGDL